MSWYYMVPRAYPIPNCLHIGMPNDKEEVNNATRESSLPIIVSGVSKPFKQKSIKEKQPSSDKNRIVLASKSLNSEYEPTDPPISIENALKRPVSRTNSIEPLRSPVHKKTKVLTDIYVDSAECSEDELTEEDEAEPLKVSQRDSFTASKPRWHEMSELDFPPQPTHLPVIKEDSLFDIQPACASISPPLHIPKFVAQVAHHRKLLGEAK